MHRLKKHSITGINWQPHRHVDHEWVKVVIAAAVDDSAALHFTEIFYNELLGGVQSLVMPSKKGKGNL
jgi:hypothetical protein